jgi:hypothetical protein
MKRTVAPRSRIPWGNCSAAIRNTTAGMLICRDATLVISDRELNGQVPALIAKMKGEEAKSAFAEYARWTRARDRKWPTRTMCRWTSPSEACLADDMSRKTAAGGNNFGRSNRRHCERSEAIHLTTERKNGLLRRGACHRARIRATRWLLAMTSAA